jgi:hypothetical protein
MEEHPDAAGSVGEDAVPKGKIELLVWVMCFHIPVSVNYSVNTLCTTFAAVPAATQ